jgi:hypothetical protein
MFPAPRLAAIVSSLSLSVSLSLAHGQTIPRPEPDFEKLPFAPKHTIVYRTPSRLTVDGKLDEPAWQAAAWSDAFVDIEGDVRPRPRFTTRMKMLWDDEFLYIAADMLEPDIWGTLTTRDAVIFQDNDFEVFIDPDGDTHEYYELEVNALKTAWDLLLPEPYRDGGSAIDGWDIAARMTAGASSSRSPGRFSKKPRHTSAHRAMASSGASISHASSGTPTLSTAAT